MFLRDARALCLDTETTGADADAARLVEIAYILLGDEEEVSGATMVDPGIEIPVEARAVHHISNSDVEGWPDHETVLLQVRAMVEPDMVCVAHSSQFDSRVLQLVDKPWVCTHRMAVHLLPELSSHSLQVVRYSLGLELPQLKDGNAHRAMYDTVCCAAVFQKLLPDFLTKFGWDITVEDAVAALNAPAILQRINFGEHRGKTWEWAVDNERWIFEWCIKKGAGGEDAVHTAQHWLDKIQNRGTGRLF